MATEKPFGDEVAFNTAGENDGKIHSFCEEEIAELLPRNKAGTANIQRMTTSI